MIFLEIPRPVGSVHCNGLYKNLKFTFNVSLVGVKDVRIIFRFC